MTRYLWNVFLCIHIECSNAALLQDISRELRDLKSKVQTFMDEKDSMTAEHQEFTKQKAKLELNINDMQDEKSGMQAGKVKNLKHSHFLSITVHVITCMLFEAMIALLDLPVAVIVWPCFQKRTEEDLKKCQERIARTEEQLQTIGPRYDEMRLKEETAAAQ